MRHLLIAFVFSILSIPSFSQSIIQCAPEMKSVAAWTAPGSAYVIDYLSCGQNVSTVQLERGFWKIQMGQRIGYVDAKYVRAPQNQVSSAIQQQAMPIPSDNARGNHGPSREAPAYPRFEIFGGYNFMNHVSPDMGDIPGALGWVASFAGNFHPNFGMEIEGSGNYLNYMRASSNSYAFGGGPRVMVRLKRVTPFAHAMFGIERSSASYPLSGGLSLGYSNNGFAMAFGGGFDWNASNNMAIRVPQADYVPVRELGIFSHNIRISGGVVFKIR